MVCYQPSELVFDGNESTILLLCNVVFLLKNFRCCLPKFVNDKTEHVFNNRIFSLNYMSALCGKSAMGAIGGRNPHIKVQFYGGPNFSSAKG